MNDRHATSDGPGLRAWWMRLEKLFPHTAGIGPRAGGAAWRGGSGRRFIMLVVAAAVLLVAFGHVAGAWAFQPGNAPICCTSQAPLPGGAEPGLPGDAGCACCCTVCGTMLEPPVSRPEAPPQLLDAGLVDLSESIYLDDVVQSIFHPPRF